MAKNENVLRGSANNILAVWQRATLKARTEGESWYVEAFQLAHDLAGEFGCEPVDAAGVIAVLSPQLDWDTNKVAAREFFEDGWTKYQTRVNNDKASWVTAGDHSQIKGPKVRAFWQAIIDPYGESDPCIDRHAVAVYCGRTVSDRERAGLERVGVRDRIQKAYRKVAKLVGQPVHVVQAVTWVQWRDEVFGNLTDDEGETAA